MVRSMEGHGWVMASRPLPSFTSPPASSSTVARMPGRGRPANPGFMVETPGRPLIRMAPVSVCHQVSTTGQRSPPITRWYHIQASGLIGSPTVPSRRRLDRSWRCGYSSPHFMKVRMAVGAV